MLRRNGGKVIRFIDKQRTKPMNHALLTLTAAFLFCSTLMADDGEASRNSLKVATTFPGATKRDFQTGKLISVTADERLYEGTSYRWAIFTVQIGDLVYTARGGRIRRRSGDFAQGLIIGDAVQVAIERGDLIFLKPDGKELKTKIIKRARAQ
jgi:hypothetical protein